MSQRQAQDQNPGAESDLPWKVRPIHYSAWTQWVFWDLVFPSVLSPGVHLQFFSIFALEFSSRLCFMELMVPCEFLRGEMKSLGSGIPVFLSAETSAHKDNTYLVLVSCRGSTIYFHGWFQFLWVSVGYLSDSREVELILMWGRVICSMMWGEGHGTVALPQLACGEIPSPLLPSTHISSQQFWWQTIHCWRHNRHVDCVLGWCTGY